MNKSLLIALGVVLVVGALFYMASNKTPNVSLTGNNANTPTSTTPTSTVPTATPGSSTVVLQETNPGNSVTVQSATLAQPGYIVIYRAKTDGSTEIVGHSSLLSAGSYTNRTISLDKSIAADESVSAVLHKDDGDGKFEVPGADAFMGSGTLRIVSDVDVVGSPMSAEPPLLKTQVETYLEQTPPATTSTSTR